MLNEMAALGTVHISDSAFNPELIGFSPGLLGFRSIGNPEYSMTSTVEQDQHSGNFQEFISWETWEMLRVSS